MRCPLPLFFTGRLCVWPCRRRSVDGRQCEHWHPRSQGGGPRNDARQCQEHGQDGVSGETAGENRPEVSGGSVDPSRCGRQRVWLEGGEVAESVWHGQQRVWLEARQQHDIRRGIGRGRQRRGECEVG